MGRKFVILELEIKMPICGIYKITEKSSGKSYIGQSIDIGRRIEQHQQDNSPGWHEKFFNNPNAFDIQILEQCLPTELDSKEKYYIEQFNTYYNGFNLTRGNGQTTEEKYTNELNFIWIDDAFTQNDVNKINKALLTDSFKETQRQILKYERIIYEDYDKITYWLDFKFSSDCFLIKIMPEKNKVCKAKDSIFILLDLIPQKEHPDFIKEEQEIKNLWYNYCEKIDYAQAPYKRLYHIKNNFGYKSKYYYFMNNLCNGEPNKDISKNYFYYEKEENNGRKVLCI